jgi:putative thiamine transport system permease protein|tara:strand:+ start:3599 stop:5308 length:1710 start_codon:yes stop_codon:yes gene_type:complete
MLSNHWPKLLMLLALGISILLPVVVGLGETMRAAFGILPALGQYSVNIDAWMQLYQLPGLISSLRLTLFSGFAATVMALLLAISGSSWVYNRSPKAFLLGRLKPLAQLIIVPVLAAPHAAIAIGLAFLIAPSGWIARWFSPWLTNWSLPPDWATVQDLWGLSLTLGLVIKELPFLWLICLVALKQIDVSKHISLAQSMGYSHSTAWRKVIVPQLYPLIRLPVMVVLVYALSTVDMAQILGPNNPPTLALVTMRLYTDANVQMLLPASAAAISLALLMVMSILLWEVTVRALMRLNRVSIRSGGRTSKWSFIGTTLTTALPFSVMLGLLSLLVLALWSITWRWSFPDPWPTSWSYGYWLALLTEWPLALKHSLITALVSSGLALMLAVIWLEVQDRFGGHFYRATLWLIYLPLLVPQIAFLYGLKVSFLRLGLSGGIGTVIWAHLLFVFPYVMLSLMDSWRALDQRYLAVAASLGGSWWTCFWRIKLSLLLRPLLIAWAIGMAVSVSQYLPTLLIGAGRVESLTTEAVSLASGADRRLVGVYGLLQALVPLLAYSLALLLPRWVALKNMQ